VAIIETACPHCHRQSQMRLHDRIADGSAGRGSAWGRRFENQRIIEAKEALREHRERSRQISADIKAAGNNIEKLMMLAEHTKQGPEPVQPLLAAFGAQCSFADCGGPVLLICSIMPSADENLVPGQQGWATSQYTAAAGGPVEISAVYPPPSALDVHANWPEIARRLIPELVEDLARNRDASRILSGARTVLDTVLRDLIGKATPKGRAQQIDYLLKEGLITPSISEWAKQLWRDGSDASHDGVGDKELATAYLDFLRVFLRVTYVLPSEIALLRAKSAI